MYEIEKIFSFEAGHIHAYHEGSCSRPHGHSYKLKIRLRHDQLIESGPQKKMIMDFQALSAIVRPMIEKYFDHHWLNDTLQCDTPTAEFIAYWIFSYLESKIPYLYSVTISETETSSATYYKN